MLLSLFLYLKINDLQSKMPNPQTQSSSHDGHDHSKHEEEIEVVEHMAFFQRFTEKLYFAGTAKNWELMDFYHHEIEENAEKIIKSNVVDEGINLSESMNMILLPKIEAMDKSIKAKDITAFDKDYNNLIEGCNSCHSTTKHPFIKITKPKTNNFSNQQF